MTEWILNDQSFVWARRDGRALCSSRDPLSEAQKWADSLRLTGRETEIGIVGVGAGQHLLEVRKRLPGARLLIFDSHAIDFFAAPLEIRQGWADLCESNVQLHQGAEALEWARFTVVKGPIFCFRSACTEIDLEIYDILLCQNPEVFSQACNRAGLLGLKAKASKIPSGIAVNLKSLSQAEASWHGHEGSQLGPASTDEKLLSVLRELVK
ncbi:MAG: hypothetical protein ACK5P7_11055 [Bdellovibrio sp.]